MDQLSPAIITSKDGAGVLIEGELEDLDDAVFAPTVCGMIDADGEGVFTIMRGSDNEMSLLTQAFTCSTSTGSSPVTRVSASFGARRTSAPPGRWDVRASERGT
jgi:hypothetical protein